MTVTVTEKPVQTLEEQRRIAQRELVSIPEFKEALDNYVEFKRRYEWDVTLAIRETEDPELPDISEINERYRAPLEERWNKMFEVAQRYIHG